MKSGHPGAPERDVQGEPLRVPRPGVGPAHAQGSALCFADFFPMFDMPFRYGSGWDAKADAGPEPVVVLDEETNEKLFGGEDSVGGRSASRSATSAWSGVLDNWRPTRQVLRPHPERDLQPPERHLHAVRLAAPDADPHRGNSDGWRARRARLRGLLVSETVWIQMWVELPTRRAAALQRLPDRLRDASRKARAASRARSTTGCTPVHRLHGRAEGGAAPSRPRWWSSRCCSWPCARST